MKISRLPFFQNSVRCLFPLASLSAIFGPSYLVTVIVNQYPFKHPLFNIFQWHAYEMLYGFLMTLIAGFLLTAAAAWTGREAIKGYPLISLFVLWFADQILLFFPMPKVLYFIIAAAFPLGFTYLAYNLLKGYKQFGRFIALISILTISKLTFIASAILRDNSLKDFATNSMLWVVIALVAIIAGRIIPNFTRNFFKLNKDLVVPTILDKAFFISIISTALWLIPHGQDWLNFSLFLIAGSLSLVRMSFYETSKALKHPIIGMLHIGYFVYSLSLIALGLGELFPEFNSGKASIHLLAAGGVSILAMNIMVRASLGHSGREIKMTPTIMISFVCIIVGAILRVFIPPIWPEYYYPSLHNSMGFWTLGFILYLIKFVPINLKKRVDA